MITGAGALAETFTAQESVGVEFPCAHEHRPYRGGDDRRAKLLPARTARKAKIRERGQGTSRRDSRHLRQYADRDRNRGLPIMGASRSAEPSSFPVAGGTPQPRTAPDTTFKALPKRLNRGPGELRSSRCWRGDCCGALPRHATLSARPYLIQVDPMEPTFDACVGDARIMVDKLSYLRLTTTWRRHRLEGGTLDSRSLPTICLVPWMGRCRHSFIAPGEHLVKRVIINVNGSMRSDTGATVNGRPRRPYSAAARRYPCLGGSSGGHRPASDGHNRTRRRIPAHCPLRLCTVIHRGPCPGGQRHR